MNNNLDTLLEERLLAIKNQGRLRSIIPVGQRPGGRLDFMGKSYLNLSGNDYLGLAADEELIREFYGQLTPDNRVEKFSPGAGASRLMTGNSELYKELEESLATRYQKESGLVFNSGYHINIGILPAITTKRDLILADKLCHASLIDGMQLSRAEVVRFRHNDYQQLETLLKEKRAAYEQVFLVSESVFSMDGDCCNLMELIRLKQQHDCFLVLDEAHGVGVLGDQGLGLAEQLGVLAEVDIFIGTFGKAFGGQGGFTVCSRTVKEFLINTARSLIFTTGLPPINLSWLLFVLEKLPDMAQRRQQTQELGDKLRASLEDKGLVTAGNTHIVPVILGDSMKTVITAQRIRQQGYWVSAVRPPTVPEGSARLRLSVSAALSWDDISPLAGLIKETLETLDANQPG